MKKRTFLLLEILIAFFLVSLCAIPLVTGPLKLHRQQTLQLVELEKERLADWTFCEIKEMLLKNEIPWKKIPLKGVETSPFSLKSARIQIPNSKLRNIKREFTLKGRGEKETADQITRIVGIYVFLDQTKYEFRLPILKKKQKKPQTPIES